MKKDIVLKVLVDLWFARLDGLAQYLNNQFGYSLALPHEFTRLIIAQTSDGNLASNNIGTRFSAKWVLKGTTLQVVPLDDAWQEMYETDQTGELYLSPSFLFYSEGNDVLLSERYGPHLIHRLRGRFLDSGQSPNVEWSTVWCSSFSVDTKPTHEQGSGGVS